MPLRRALVAAVIGLLAGGAAVLLQLTHSAAGGGIVGPLFALEAAAQDLALQARQPESYLQLSGSNAVPVRTDPRDLLVIVAIDERTIAELGAYNGGYPRHYHADVLERLLADPPRVIGLDLGFFEPTADDDALAAALDHARQRLIPTRVVLAGVGLLSRGEPPGRADDGELRFERGLLPVAQLADRADIGLSNVLPDERGTIRGMPLVSYVGDVERPTLGLAVVSAYLRRPQPIDARPEPGTLEIAGRQVPVDETASVQINFFGPPSDSYSPRGTFRVVSFVDVLRGRLDADTWRGKIVLVGASGVAGLADDYWTPLSGGGHKMSGVEIHANVAATLLSTQFLRPAPRAAQVGLILALALCVSMLAVRLSGLSGGVATLLLLLGAAFASLWGLYAFGIELPLANPIVGGVLAFAGVGAWRVGIEQRQSRGLQHALASVVPPSVALQIARAPEKVRLGVEQRTISVLFSDLKGFTTFSESVTPEVVARVTNDYLAAMTAVVFEHGGTLDKFVGDAVMALWNAPLDDASHARHACHAALAMQAALSGLNARWTAEGLPCQRMRIGVHTGVASVGNVGTSQRFAYTAVGDTVNLAARLEPLNNEYGTWTCVSQATLDQAGEGFLVRFLDLVAVKGKATPVGVYELIGCVEDAASVARWSPILGPYHQGMLLYQARQFVAAAEQFRTALCLAGDEDGPSSVYAARCAELATAPPGPDWNGVFVMHHK